MTKDPVNFKRHILLFIAVIFFIAINFLTAEISYAGTLSCSVATSCSGGTVIMKMYATSNSHAELESQSNYSQLVCCTGVTGLGNSCSGTYAVATKLSGTTNAHIEQNSQSNYANSACISVASGTVSIGYQSSNCSGYDTTLASMSGTTNAHAGDGNAYTTKICATAAGSAGSVSTDIVDESGNPVGSPSVSFGGSNFSFGTQQSTGTLGISSQKMRVTSTLADWTVAIAATSGPTVLWTSGGNNYDFNNSASAGRLQVDASGSTITPQGGCSTTGLSKGSSNYFAQGTLDSITLLSGSSAQTGCYWDLTSVNLTQDLPASQVAGSYSIGMTLTAS